MIDKSDKCVVLYDSDSDAVSRHLLPKTHDVLIFRYDLSSLLPQDVVAACPEIYDSKQDCKQPFVYVEVRGTILANQVISKAELTAVLRERDLFDYCIDLHYSTQSKSASESRRGASIEQILHRTFPGKELAKAKRYLAYDEGEKLFTDIRERILLIIKTLSLDGFRSFSNARLDFLPGQNYIFGQNWQGKSSIVDAIRLPSLDLTCSQRKLRAPRSALTTLSMRILAELGSNWILFSMTSPTAFNAFSQADK